MTPNPTARPFLVGMLLFLAVLGLWAGRAQAGTGTSTAPKASIARGSR